MCRGFFVTLTPDICSIYTDLAHEVTNFVLSNIIVFKPN